MSNKTSKRYIRLIIKTNIRGTKDMGYLIVTPFFIAANV